MSKTAPQILVDLDRERRLRYDFNALRLIESETGKNMLDQSSWASMNATEVVVLIWAGLKWEAKELTLDDVGAMLHPGNLEGLMAKIEKAWSTSMPEPSTENSPLTVSRQA